MRTNAIFTAFITAIEIGVIGVLEKEKYANQLGNGSMISHILVPYGIIFFVIFCSSLLLRYRSLDGKKVSFSCGIVSYQKGATSHEFFN